MSPEDAFLSMLTRLFHVRIDIISKLNRDNVTVHKARDMHDLPVHNLQPSSMRRKLIEAERKKLVNVIYHDKKYFVQEPWPDKVMKRDPDLIIEKHLWIILRFMPKMRTEIGLNDVIRFGRLTFKVTEFVITEE